MSKFKATRIAAGLYHYLGFEIVKGKSEGFGNTWCVNSTTDADGHHDSCSAVTLEEAKSLCDDRRAQEANAAN